MLTKNEVLDALNALHRAITGNLAADAQRRPQSGYAETKQTATAPFGAGEDDKGAYLWWGIGGKRSKIRLDTESTQVWRDEGWRDDA